MKIFVTGAAGYIGSIVVEQLVERGDEVIAFDNLSHGHRAAVHLQASFVQGDLLDRAWLLEYLRANPVEAVVHLAAEALVDESIRNPALFYQVNVTGGLNLLDAMVAAGIKQLVFSSTAAVYGEPAQLPITEASPHQPVNAYGESKLAFERALHWYRRAYGLQYVTLRYFNACGASERYGEYHLPETHILPILFETALGQRPAFSLYGTDYDTPDGTCIRDYIHVADIAQAHLLALGRLGEIGGRAYNLGNGAGFSNRQVIEAVEEITGRALAVVSAPRRPGDPARLVASAASIRRDLGWEPRFPTLQDMIASAWRWRQAHPLGYTTPASA
jgi:UDP-glucose 4-epimerase